MCFHRADVLLISCIASHKARRSFLHSTLNLECFAARLGVGLHAIPTKPSIIPSDALLTEQRQSNAAVRCRIWREECALAGNPLLKC